MKSISIFGEGLVAGCIFILGISRYKHRVGVLLYPNDIDYDIGSNFSPL